MNYGLYYKEVVFNRQAMDIVRRAISQNLKWIKGEIHNNLKSNRSSEIAWLGDQRTLDHAFAYAEKINRDAGWNLKIDGIEPVQFGIYGEGDFYDWHVDQHPRPVRGRVRKISMSLFLNDDFAGGDFDLEIYKPGTEPKVYDIQVKTRDRSIFSGDQWHRVRPVTSGLRKSLVAWFYGPPYS